MSLASCTGDRLFSYCVYCRIWYVETTLVDVLTCCVMKTFRSKLSGSLFMYTGSFPLSFRCLLTCVGVPSCTHTCTLMTSYQYTFASRSTFCMPTVLTVIHGTSIVVLTSVAVTYCNQSIVLVCFRM